MTRPTVRFGGAAQGGGGGKEVITVGPDIAWRTVYVEDYTTLPDQDLSPSLGDGERLLNGRTLRLSNADKLVTAAVGASYGGLRLTYTAGQQNRAEGLRNTGRVAYDLEQLLAGHAELFEKRSDTEIRISWRWGFYGAAISTTYDGRAGGITTASWNASGGQDVGKTLFVRQGTYNNATSSLHRVASITQPTGVRYQGKQIYTEADIPTDYPNCLRMTIKAGRIATLEYSEDPIAPTLDAASWKHAWSYIDTNLANMILIDARQVNKAEFWVGLDRFYASGTLGGVTLQELKVEARPSLRSDVVVAAA